MAKSNKKQNAKSNNKKQKATKQNAGAGKAGVVGMRLDVGARDYARLLNDPCYGKVVQPLYDASGSGQLLRVETDFTLGGEATSIGAMVLFRTGLLSAASHTGVLTPTTVVSSDSAPVIWGQGYTKTPGNAFLGMMASVRTVAACLQVQYIGTEQSRSGVIAVGQLPAGAATSANTPALLRGLCGRVVRVPDGVVEIKFTPTAHSEEFRSTTNPTEDLDLPTLCCSVSGLANNTAVRVRCIQVLEWTSKSEAGSGTASTITVPSSNNTINQVLRTMGERDPGWQYDLLTGMGAYAAKAVLL